MSFLSTCTVLVLARYRRSPPTDLLPHLGQVLIMASVKDPLIKVMHICYADLQTLHGTIVSLDSFRGSSWCGSGSDSSLRIHANPDPQHCFQKEKKFKNVKKYKIFALNIVRVSSEQKP
jgi:hypothetical protein